MNGSGCKTCPEVSCDCVYRGSICKERRAEHGLGDPMTNADRIRAMSDEELADLFDAVTNAPCITICGNYDRCKRNNAWEPICRNHHLAWLQQPAEEGEHE